MTRLYRIALTSGDSGLPHVSETRRRVDAARLVAERLAYDVIAANGGLDTLQGHTAMARVRAIHPARGGEAVVYGRLLLITPSHAVATS